MTSIPPANSSDQPDTTLHPFEGTTLSASLTTSDLPKSLTWYRDLLGFTVSRSFERDGSPFAVSLRGGAIPILLTQDDGARGADRVKGAGISLMLTTPQNIDELATRLKDAGITLETEPFERMGTRAFRVRDPDGFLLVISSER